MWPRPNYRSHKYVPRHLRMTEADRRNKVNRQRERREETGYLAFSHTLKGMAERQNINLEEYYLQRLKEQEGKCAICGKSQEECKTRLAIDHCHRTDTFRGLLCYSCNTKLGFVEKYLRKIVDYLRRYR